MKKAVGGKSRVDLAVDQIIQVILDRDMKAGDKLPNEYDLARELGVGRSTLREAIKRLVARNILTARQGAGTFVSEKNGVPEDPLGLTFMMEEGSENLALDLQDIRLMLEPETCAIVARGATPEQIDQMQAYCDEAPDRSGGGLFRRRRKVPPVSCRMQRKPCAAQSHPDHRLGDRRCDHGDER